MSDAVGREHRLDSESGSNKTCERRLASATGARQQHNDIDLRLHKHRRNQKVLHHIWLAELVLVEPNFQDFRKAADRHRYCVVLRNQVVFLQVRLDVVKHIVRNVLSLLQFAAFHYLAGRPELLFVEFADNLLESDFDARSEQEQIFLGNLLFLTLLLLNCDLGRHFIVGHDVLQVGEVELDFLHCL
jgi:hypothetical protein